MLTILCGILLDVFLVIVLVNLGLKSKSIWPIIEMVLFISVVVALFAPIKGYENKELIKEFEIGPYVAQDIFSFTYIDVGYSVILTEDEELVKTYSKVTVPLARAKIFFEEEGNKPVLKTYKKHVIRNIWWTFALIDEVTEYEIYIPINLAK